MKVEFSEYQDGLGNWHVGFFKKFQARIDNFVLPARALGLPLNEYYEFVIRDYKPDGIYHNDRGLVVFTWTNYAKAHNLVLYLNKAARKNNLTI